MIGSDADLAEAFPAERWGLAGATTEPLGGGMNSVTALVTTPQARYVAKWVAHDRHDDLLAGAEVASALAHSGLRTGPSRPAAGGELVVPLAGGWCSLSLFVPGEPLTGDTEQDQRDIERVLSTVHRAGEAGPVPFLTWLHAGLPELDVEPWVRPAVIAAVDEFRALPTTRHAWLHTDPAPGAFLRDGDVVGLIDWTGATVGPVLYDVASAVMYLGGPGEAEAFLAEAGEVDHLDVGLRFRWAVQAAYFAGRIEAGDLTGTDEAGNRKGLADARRGLGA